MKKQLYLYVSIILILLVPVVSAGFRTYSLPDNDVIILNSTRSDSDYKTFIFSAPATAPDLGDESEMVYSTEETYKSKKITASSLKKEDDKKISKVENTFPSPVETESKRVSAFALPTASIPLNLYNNFLNISFNEKNSGTKLNAGLDWKYKYNETEWGNSNYYEFYMISSDQTSLVSSDNNLSITRSFDSSNSSDLTYLDHFNISRTIYLPSGDQKYFQIKYILKAAKNLTNVSFFQIIDFDVPDTNNSHQTDDAAEYDSFNDYIFVKDENYFQDGFKADMASSKHGILAYGSDSYDEWRIGDLNNKDEFNNGTDPVVGMQYDLGNISAGESKQIIFTFWFGQPTGFLTKEVSIYPAANFDRQTKQLNINAYIYDNNIGEKITNGTVIYYIYNSSDAQKATGVLSYNLSWSADANLSSLNNGEYHVKVAYDNYEEQLDFAIVRGYGNINGNVLDINNNIIDGATVKLYKTSAYFYGYSAKQATISNSTGGFYFNNITPGSYLIEATEGSNTGKTLSFSVNGKDEFVKNITLGNNTKISQLSPLMKQLKNKISAQMIYENDLMAEISQRAKDDLGQSVGAWEVVDFASNIISANPVSVSSLSNAIVNSLERATFGVFLKNLIQYSTYKKINSLINDAEKNSTLHWIIDNLNPHDAVEFAGKAPYPNSEISLSDQHTNFRQLSTTADFDFNRASEIISSQINQLDSIKNGKLSLIISPESDQVDSLTLPEIYRKYMQNAAMISAGDFSGKFLSTIKLGLGTISVITSATGVGAPIGAAAATIATAITAPQTGISRATVKRKVQGSIDFVSSSIGWVNDIQFMPNIYNNTAEFLKNEANSKYYLDGSKNFNSTITVDLNADDDSSGVNIIDITTSLHKEKQAAITIKNTGDDSSVRVTGEGLWNYNLPNSKNDAITDIFGNVDYITLSTGTGYFNQNLSTNQQTTQYLNYSSFFYDPVNMFNPHILNVNVFNGPFMVKSVQEFYYPVPILLKPFVASSLAGKTIYSIPINKDKTKEEFSRLATKPKLLYGGNLE